MILCVNDHGRQFNDFVSLVGDAVALAGGTDRHIAGCNCADHAVVIVLSSSLDDIKQLRILVVQMIADAAAGIQSDLGKKSAFFIELKLVI